MGTQPVHNAQAHYIANNHTMQFHRRDCIWVSKINDSHKQYLSTIDEALQAHFDGCAFCLPEYHHYVFPKDDVTQTAGIADLTTELSKDYSRDASDNASTIKSLNVHPLQFERSTRIEFELNDSATIDIKILNQDTGALDCLLVANQLFQSGPHVVEWNGTNDNDEQVAGQFKCRIEAGEEQRTAENLIKTLNYFPSTIYNQDLDKGPLKDTQVAYTILSYKNEFSRENAIELAKTDAINKLFLVFAGQQGFMGKEENLLHEDMDDIFCIDLTGGDKYIEHGKMKWQGTYQVCTSCLRKSVASLLFDTYQEDGLVVDVLNVKYDWDKKKKKKQQIIDNFFAKDNDGLGELFEAFAEKEGGKIFICGFSRGGVFSLKVAQRLKDLYGDKHRIQAVVTIDPVINPISREWSLFDETNLVKHFAAHMKKVVKTPYQKTVKDKWISGYFKKTSYYTTNYWGKRVKKSKREWINGYWTYKTVTRYHRSWKTQWYTGISGAEIIAKGVLKMLLDPLRLFSSEDSRLLIYRSRFPVLKEVPGVQHYNVFQRLGLQSFWSLEVRKTPIGAAVDGAISPSEDSYWQATERSGELTPVADGKPFNQYDASVQRHTPDMLRKYWRWIYAVALREMS
jgi:pimeloyl-ACP methyl ester carboxylesterase